MKIIQPYHSTGKAEAYRDHKLALRFLHVVGEGIRQVDHTIAEGFEEVNEQQRRIHGALVDQTQVIQEGLFGIELSLEQGFDQMAEKLDTQTEAVERVRETLLFTSEQLQQGLAGLKASFDMGFADILAEFELQRSEIQVGFEKLADLLENSRKTQARERYLDGKQAYERFQQFPDEPQFLLDARDYLEESVEIYRGNPFCHFYLGHIYQESEPIFDLERSLKHYELCATYAKGLENTQLAALGYFFAGWIQYVLGDRERAIEQALKALEYDPEGLPENYYNLARYYAGQGEAAFALRYLNTAVQRFDPLYTVKADMDQDFLPIRKELEAYFLRLREEAAEQWDRQLQQFRLLDK